MNRSVLQVGRALFFRLRYGAPYWWRRRHLRRAIVYIHPAYLRPGRLAQWRELEMQIVAWVWGDNLTAAAKRQSLLLDPRYGLVGDGPAARRAPTRTPDFVDWDPHFFPEDDAEPNAAGMVEVLDAECRVLLRCEPQVARVIAAALEYAHADVEAIYGCGWGLLSNEQVVQILKRHAGEHPHVAMPRSPFGEHDARLPEGRG